jgi:hypothetical protein
VEWHFVKAAFDRNSISPNGNSPNLHISAHFTENFMGIINTFGEVSIAKSFSGVSGNSSKTT